MPLTLPFVVIAEPLTAIGTKITTLMKKTILLLIAALLLGIAQAPAQAPQLTAKRGVLLGGYNFWVRTPQGYNSATPQPLVIFLHGASLCGRDLNRVKRYGPLDAETKGLEIPAVIVAPQNPGGSWSPRKLNDMLEWVKRNYAIDTTRVYVLGMSLGGYGTMDFAGTYPHKIAAAMALCGGSTLKSYDGLGQLPLWIMHGTGDRAISVTQSKIVVAAMQAARNDTRLRYDWLAGASHGALARIFYLEKTYEWLLSHSLAAPGRPVNRHISITQADMRNAYSLLSQKRRQPAPEPAPAEVPASPQPTSPAK